MKILMLTYNDWSNTGWRFSKCVEHIGLPIKFYKGKLHRFGYPKQGAVHPILNKKKPISKHPIIIDAPELKPLVDKANVIHFTASTFINTHADLSKKTVIIQHGGGTYRNQPKKANKLFNKIADISIIQTPDLLNLGAKNEQYIAFPIDTNFIQPSFKTNKPLKIGHFPSTAALKGTNMILQTITNMSLNHIVATKKLPWEDNLKRMSECDIIIEKMQPKLLHGMSGEWGNTALEAAALGKIVITNSHRPSVYEKEYGDCPLLIANNQDTLKNQIEHVLSMSEDKILRKKIETRQWAVDNHSFEATAKRLWEKIYGRINACKT